jgi:uncharacterized protein (UPF0332 family)
MGVTSRELEIKEQLIWCKHEARKMIKFAAPRANVVRARIAQAREELQAMDVLANANLNRPAINSSYWSKFHAVRALLEEFGLRCKNHTCIVTLFEYLFSNFVSQDDINDFSMSKEDREDSQYNFAAPRADLQKKMRKSKKFVLDVENLLDDFRSGKQNAATVKQKINALKSW